MNFSSKVHAKDTSGSPQTPTTPTSKSEEKVKEETSQNTNESKTPTPETTNTGTPSTTDSTTNSESTSYTENKDPPYFWMVKPCAYYKAEYKDCKSFKARFNQYFVYGESQECGHWKGDYDNCTLWEEKKDREALDRLIESEKARVRQRLRNHHLNDVWENRTAPPEDWNSELPEFISKGYKGSYLEVMNEQIKEDAAKRKIPYSQILSADRNEPSTPSSCVIM